jgi:hypothetical protein
MTQAPFFNFVFNWETLSVLAAGLSVLISISLIMFSRLFELRELEQTAKKEFVFAASTVFLVLFVISMLSFGDDILTKVGRLMYIDAISENCVSEDPEVCKKLDEIEVKSASEETLIDVMLLYMEAPALCTQKFLDVLYIISIPVEACASLFMEIFMSEHMSCFGFKFVAERITNTTQMMTFYMFAYFLLVHILNFVKFYAGYFFVLGVVLRAAPPTRGAGAYLMALSVGLYFVLPFSYILISTVSLIHSNTGFIQAEGNADATSLGDVQSEKSGLSYFCAKPALGNVEGLDCGTESIEKQFEYRSWLKANEASIFSFMDDLHDILLHIASVICVFPLVAMVIFFTFVLNTTNLFGGNIPEIGRGLVRLI